MTNLNTSQSILPISIVAGAMLNAFRNADLGQPHMLISDVINEMYIESEHAKLLVEQSIAKHDKCLIKQAITHLLLGGFIDICGNDNATFDDYDTIYIIKKNYFEVVAFSISAMGSKDIINSHIGQLNTNYCSVVKAGCKVILNSLVMPRSKLAIEWLVDELVWDHVIADDSEFTGDFITEEAIKVLVANKIIGTSFANDDINWTILFMLN